MAPEEEVRSKSAARSPGWLRVALLGALGVAAFFAIALFTYELALARVPQHRAALERLVRAQTGLDVRFNELGLRWGWYGPEAVFRRVELDRPGSADVLLRAPELIVGFDAWRTLRSGQPEAGRIELVAPDIDFVGAGQTMGAAARAGAVAKPGATAGAALLKGASTRADGLDRIAILERWRGGRVDIEGGTLRLPDPAGGSNPVTLQIRRASLRRSDNEWSLFGLVFLPDRLGHSARVVLRVNGDLDKPDALGGSLKLEVRRLLFPGCRDFLAAMPDLASRLPRGGRGDLSLELDFEQGQIVKASGNVQATGVVFDTPAGSNPLMLDNVSGDWRVARNGSGWRIRVDSLELGKGEPVALLTINTSNSAEDSGEVGLPASGVRVRGNLDRAPVASVVAIARWLTPNLDLAGADLEGLARNVTFDWDPLRPDGERLHTSARLEDVVLVPQSKDFTLSGLEIRVSGNESQLRAELQSRAARLELAQSKQYPLSNLLVSSTLRISNTADGWQIATDEFLLEHHSAALTLTGSVQGGPPDGASTGSESQITASGTLAGADIPFIERLLGENTARAFGAAASRLTAGQILNAEFHLSGPLGELPFGGRGDSFTGSLVLRNAILSGGDLWPDAEGIDARVEWHGARIEATIEAGHAGPFQLASARASWDAAGESATRFTGHINGRLEDAVAWVHDHPRLQEYVPEVQDIDASGNAAFDFAVSVPPYAQDHDRSESQEPRMMARVSTFLDGAQVQAVAGLPSLEGISGSFTFDAGRLQRSTLTGTWLGGPVTLRVGERREKGARVFAVQAQGVLNAQQLANLANVTGTVQGNTEWNGELAYVQGSDSQTSRWRMVADSSLLGVLSSLPEPFSKRPTVAVPVHLEVAGTNDTAVMHVNLGDRMRTSFALQRKADVGWAVDKGAVRFGTEAAALPAEHIVSVRGHIGQLDLPVYAMAWQRLRRDSVPTLRAQLAADRMMVAGRNYGEVTLRAERTDAGTELEVDSAGIQGVARWPAAPRTTGVMRGDVVARRAQPAELHLTRLDVPDSALPSDGIGVIATLAPVALISVDDLNWRGHSLGRLTATVAAQSDIVVLDNVRLVNDTHDAHGTLRCGSDSATCELTFMIDSTDAAATLADFGLRPDLVATEASLSGDVEWRMATDQSWLAGLKGTLSMHLADGTVRGWRRTSRADFHADEIGAATTAVATWEGIGDHLSGAGDNVALATSDGGEAWPFALLAVPALVGGLDEPRSGGGAALARPQRELRFARLEADFELHDGQATTSNLHFDGDAEILMRGRIGLVSRDYDQQVWVLRGEERLPAAVRRFGATPRVAAVWLSLRDLFTSGEAQDRSRAALRLQGSWDDPMVVAAN